MIVVLGSVVAQEAVLADALALSREHVARSRAEPGCLSHAVYQDPENRARLVFVETWADQAALEMHFRVPASRAFAKSLAGFAVGMPEMTLYESTPLPVPGRTPT